MSETSIGPRTYVVVFGALMLLTALTVWVATIDLGAFNVVVALTIASVKATLVVLYFMHLRHSSRLTQLVAGAGLLWLLLLLCGTLTDYLTRGSHPLP